MVLYSPGCHRITFDDGSEFTYQSSEHDAIHAWAEYGEWNDPPVPMGKWGPHDTSYRWTEKANAHYKSTHCMLVRDGRYVCGALLDNGTCPDCSRRGSLLRRMPRLTKGK